MHQTETCEDLEAQNNQDKTQISIDQPRHVKGFQTTLCVQQWLEEH